MPRLFLLAALALPLAACDADESLFAEFTATVATGADVEAVEGEAVYSVVQTPAGPRFVLALFEGDLIDSDRDDYDVIAFSREGARLGVGAYAVVEAPDGARAIAATYADVEDADDALDARGPVVRGTAGTLTITSVDSHGLLTGVFQFDGEGFRVEAPDAPLEASASGRFEALYVSPGRLRARGVDLGL